MGILQSEFQSWSKVDDPAISLNVGIHNAQENLKQVGIVLCILLLIPPPCFFQPSNGDYPCKPCNCQKGGNPQSMGFCAPPCLMLPALLNSETMHMTLDSIQKVLLQLISVYMSHAQKKHVHNLFGHRS